MADATCSVPKCERPPRTRGWCVGHYNRWVRSGDTSPAKPLRRRSPSRSTPAERVMANTECLPSGCWQWQATIDSNGYGRIRVDGRTAYSHRFAYEALVGPIPEGLHLDHLCRNRACCNPGHLDPVTCLENVRRGEGHGSKTHCPQGHSYSGENLSVYDGRRYCRTCNMQRSKDWYHAHKSA